MMFSLFLSLSYFIAMGSMNSIKPESSEEVVPEGGNIKLSCKYEGRIFNIQWYKQQHQRSRPEFLLLITEDGSISPEISGFSAHINKSDTRVDLEIISAAVTDSAVYYCAVKPTVTGNTTNLIICLDVCQMLFLSLGNSCEDDITANRAAVFSAEGQTVSLSCNYSVKAENLQWYRQDPGSAPHYLLMITDTKEPEVLKAAAVNSRLTAELNQERNQVYLQIISAAVTDSAVYYCAVRPTVTGNTTTLYKNTTSTRGSHTLLHLSVCDDVSFI
ncbi:T cell receptor alpha chain [Solea senegalensis]|nr:T cell receptor alpha chain [Solea senegalensis]